MIAIHDSGNWSFRPEWEAYCKSNSIPYKLVNAYDSDIVNKVKDCSAFMFHFHHTKPEDYNFAKQLIFALNQIGLPTFPDFNTGWHFDDKLGQKYLLEASGAPTVPTFAFYEKESAIEFIKNTTFPKVFKLRGGAGSNNVSLINDRSKGLQIVDKAFSHGFDNYNKWGDFKENIRLYRFGKTRARDILKSLRRTLISTDFGKTAGKERNYLLLQDFIPNNSFDIRVVTIGNKSFAIKRPVRTGDFRASGSGNILYEKREIDERCIQIAFETTENLKAQCLAFDFVFDEVNKPLIVEISYGFAHRAYEDCPGYWKRDLSFVEGEIDPCGWMVEGLINMH